MQFKTLLFASLVAVAAADDIATLVGKLPQCSLTCLLAGASGAGCDATDYNCQCAHSADIQKAVQPCLQKACTTADLASKCFLSRSQAVVI